MNSLTTLPQFEPGEWHKKGSLVQNEVPLESADQYFHLVFTAEFFVFVINTNSYAKSTDERH
jgi:hypothetical protein